MTTHQQRMNVHQIDPKATQAVLAMQRYVDSSGLDHRLGELVKIRASQLNGCAYCLDMHTRDARKLGEDQRRLDILSAWREAPSFFDDRERAALALTEAVTLVADNGVPDSVWDEVAQVFTDIEVVHLLMAISTINVWNRLAIATHQDLPENPS